MQFMGGGLRQLTMSATPQKMQSALERAQTTGDFCNHVKCVLTISDPALQGIKTEVNGTIDKVVSAALMSCKGFAGQFM